MDLELKCSSVAVGTTTSNKQMIASIEDAIDGDILNHFKIEDIISHFGDDRFLDEIGEDRVIKYFRIEVKEYE